MTALLFGFHVASECCWCWSAVVTVLPEVRVRKESPDSTRFHVSICGVSKSSPEVQFPNLGAGCGFCVYLDIGPQLRLRDGGLQLAYRASSVCAGSECVHFKISGPANEGNVHVTRLHSSSVNVTFVLRQILTGEVKREADLPEGASPTLPSLALHRGVLTRIVYLIPAVVHALYLLCVISEGTLTTNVRAVAAVYVE